MAGKRKAGSTGSTGSTGRAPSRATAAGSGRGAKPGGPTRPAGKGKGGAKGKGPKPPLTTKARLRRIALYAGLAGLALVLLAAGAFAILYQTTDLPDPNDEFETQTSFVYYSDGKSELGKFAIQNRDAISYDEMPQDIKDAVVAAENRSFWDDQGIDVKGIIRAVFNNAQGNQTQGASTITQQYIKVLYLTQERSYTRKLKEAILSLKLGRQVSKQEILEGYLNTIYFGRGAYGIQAAALAYFEKPAAELTLEESAVLASVINNPSRFDPANGKEAKKALRERYRYVLDGMAAEEQITEEQAASSSRRLPKFPEVAAESTYGGQRGHLLAMVKKELLTLTNKDTGERFTEDEIDGGGIRVTTTFTRKAMDAAEQGVLAARPEGFSDKELHIGVASVQVDTGAVRGIYGGQDYLDSQINWAVSGGQAGSILKPFALAAGLKDGFALKDTFDGNSPYVLPNGDDIENQGNTSYGSAINLIKATEDSVNTAFIDLTMSMENGPEKIVEMMNAMGLPPEERTRTSYGIPDRTPGLVPVPSVALGSATVSPINMANGFSTIANGGRFHEPYIIEKVVTDEGDVLYDHSVSDDQVIDDELGTDIAADVSYALQQVVSSGSGTAALGLGRPAAGKTGTSTNSNGDVVSAWFTGYTPQMATSVVYTRGKGVGKLDGWLPSFFGGDYPAETWTEVMTRAMEGVEEEDFPPPAYVDGEAPDDGHAPTSAPPATTRPPQTQQPSDSEEPTKTPTQVPTPTTDPTTSAPPPPPPPPPSTQPPPPSETPCGVLGNCSPTPTPTPSPSPTASSGGSPSGPPSPRTYAWWSRMLW